MFLKLLDHSILQEIRSPFSLLADLPLAIGCLTTWRSHLLPMAWMSAVLIITRTLPLFCPVCLLPLNWQRNKAVADGAVSYHIDHFVRTRIAKYSYGTESSLPYDSSNPEHMFRPHSVYTDLNGHKKIRGSFSVILPKVDAATLLELLLMPNHV